MLRHQCAIAYNDTSLVIDHALRLRLREAACLGHMVLTLGNALETSGAFLLIGSGSRRLPVLALCRSLVSRGIRHNIVDIPFVNVSLGCRGEFLEVKSEARQLFLEVAA